MNLTVKEVSSKKDLKQFVEFPYGLYKGNAAYVPALRFDEYNTLRKDKNPAFEHCDARYWLAFDGDKVVGRVAAILNRLYIERWQNKYLRFGWFDFENDPAIAKALLEPVEQWAKDLGMDAVHGPLGFSDLDHEGMLIEGFDQLGTLGALYTYEYYHKAVEQLGYSKDADWVEYKIRVPDVLPEKLEKLAEIIKQKFQVHKVEAKKAKDVLPYASRIFELINDTYAHLYGVVPLTERQIQTYTKQYFSFIRPDFVPLVADKNGKVIAFGISMPSLSKALQKANGSLLPFGFVHILKAMKRNDMADLYLVAVDKEYQGKGINAILITEMFRAYKKFGIREVESNPELEDNTKVQSFWSHFDAVQHKRRRCYIKRL